MECSFALGATMAYRSACCVQIGGLEALVDYLGDDYELGARTAAAGYKVELADVVVETAVPDYTFGQFWSHQMRWARNNKHLRIGAVLRADRHLRIGWRNLAVMAAPQAWWTWTAFAIVAATRLAAVVTIGRGVLNDPNVLRDLWLVPARDFAALAVWVASFGRQRSGMAGNEVQGERREAGEGVTADQRSAA